MTMPSFSSRLIGWQKLHGRHGLPWQGADAYGVWLSEIMLQQTQVATVIPYYQRFVAAFPTIAALAAASEEQVLAHWSGLGYYARGRNLHRAAQIIAEKYQGEFPREIGQILELPGVGRSTAAAICSLAYRQRRAILDGNVKRVLSRHGGIAGWAGDKKVEAQLWQRAEALLPPASARQDEFATYTQALMDLGAAVCTRSKPQCPACPVKADCVALQTVRVSELPAPRPKKAVPEKHAAFLLLLHGNEILLERRPGSGIWGGLWCPPQFEDKAAATAWCARQNLECLDEGGGEASQLFTHTFTHFKLHITPVRLRLVKKPSQVRQPGSMWLDVEEALRGAIPTPVRKMLSQA
ncbi:MAG TPA: A/G-specific adenine glycosylase [Gallionellaceae bacterium]